MSEVLFPVSGTSNRRVLTTKRQSGFMPYVGNAAGAAVRTQGVRSTNEFPLFGEQIEPRFGLTRPQRDNAASNSHGTRTAAT